MSERIYTIKDTKILRVRNAYTQDVPQEDIEQIRAKILQQMRDELIKQIEPGQYVILNIGQFSRTYEPAYNVCTIGLTATIHEIDDERIVVIKE